MNSNGQQPLTWQAEYRRNPLFRQGVGGEVAGVNLDAGLEPDLHHVKGCVFPLHHTRPGHVVDTGMGLGNKSPQDRHEVFMVGELDAGVMTPYADQ